MNKHSASVWLSFTIPTKKVYGQYRNQDTTEFDLSKNIVMSQVAHSIMDVDSMSVVEGQVTFLGHTDSGYVNVMSRVYESTVAEYVRKLTYEKLADDASSDDSDTDDDQD